MPPPEPDPLKAPDILLDSCVIQYIADKRIRNGLVPYLTDILKRNHTLALSEITVYELLQGAPITKEAELIDWIKVFKHYVVDLNVLVAAARLRTFYDMNKLPQAQISDGDKIIAATSTLTGSLVLTANGNDFPRPFFIEVEQRQVYYSSKNIQKMITLQLLAPNHVVLTNFFSNRPK